MKFKIGDKVRILEDHPSFAKLLKDEVVTVLGIESKNNYTVSAGKLKDDKGNLFTNKWHVRAKDLELYKTKVQLPEELFEL